MPAYFGGLYYLSLYFAGKLHVLDSRGEVWKLFVVLTPSLGAALVAGSRIMDARHHPFDVLSGSLIGIIFAWAAYRQYFPSVSEFHAKGRAYPMVRLAPLNSSLIWSKVLIAQLGKWLVGQKREGSRRKLRRSTSNFSRCRPRWHEFVKYAWRLTTITKH